MSANVTTFIAILCAALNIRIRYALRKNLISNIYIHYALRKNLMSVT